MTEGCKGQVFICWECDVTYCEIHAEIHDKLHTVDNPTTWVLIDDFACLDAEYPATETVY